MSQECQHCGYVNHTETGLTEDDRKTEPLECSISRIADALEIIAETMSAPEREKRARLRKAWSS